MTAWGELQAGDTPLALGQSCGRESRQRGELPSQDGMLGSEQLARGVGGMSGHREGS